LVVEYAKSGRATCKHCNTVIAKGSVRLGSVTKDRGHDNTKWHHPVCFVKNSPKSMDAAKLAGFTDLKDSDRDALGALTVCTTDVEPSHKHDDKRIRIDDASASSEKEQKGQVMLYNAKLWEKTLQSFDLSQLSTTYKDACLPKGWKSFSSVIFHEVGVP
jgi:bifunctional polynucleotide phosphatase/kinase